MIHRNIASLIVICLLGLQATTLHAGILQAFSGNSRSKTTAAIGQQITDNFAVFDRLSGNSAAGDIFGTGFAGFDGIETLDTSARYLYLYQNVAGTGDAFTAFANFTVGDGQNRFSGVTSSAQWNLYLHDDGGVISSTNSFGLDGVAFQVSSPANVGVTSPSVGSGSQTQHQVTLSVSPAAFSVNFQGGLGLFQMSDLFGFTTNTAPELVASPPSTATFAGATVAAPQAVPEPSSIALLVVGSLGLFAARRRMA